MEMTEFRMNIMQMINLCNAVTGTAKGQIRILAHEVRKEYEYIDFWDTGESLDPFQTINRHRIRKLMGHWKLLY